MSWSKRAPIPALICLLLVSASAAAREFEVVRGASSSVSGVGVAHDRQRVDYLTVWWSQSSGAVEARAVRSTAEGVELGPVRMVAEEPGNLIEARIAPPATDGTYLAVWEVLEPNRRTLFGRLLSSEGEPLAEAFRISPDDLCDAHLFGVDYSNATDRWLVAWSGTAVNNRSPDCERVRARFVDVRGRPGKELPSRQRGSIRNGGDVAYSSVAEAFLIVWSEGRTTIFGRFVTEPLRSGSDGDLVFAVGPEGCISWPAVAASSVAERWLVTWRDECLESQPMFLSRTLEANARMTRPRLVRAADQLFGMALGFNEKSGRFVASWEEADSVGRHGRDVFSRPFKRQGRPLGPSRPIGRRTRESEDSARPSCAADRAECLHVWVRRFDEVVGQFLRPRRSGRR